MNISRRTNSHAEAKRLMHLMGYCGANRLRVVRRDVRDWLASGRATTSQLAKFCVMEVRHEIEKERQEANART